MLTSSAKLHSEDGAVLVFVALIMPVMILLMSFTLNIGNWFQHQRHLQTQADAGALAAAQEFHLPCSATIDSNIVRAAQKYSGISGTSYNQQIGSGNNKGTIAENFNQPEYPDPSLPTGYQPNGPTDTTVNTIPPASGAQFSGPCEANMFDIKMNEIGLPWWFKAAGVPYINAHARVQIENQTGGTQLAPLAVQTSDPNAAEAFFINEDNGNQLAGAPVVTLTDTNTTNSAGQELWTSSATSPFSLTIPNNTPDIGVIIALADKSSRLTSQMSTTCGQPVGVFCFDQSPGPSLLHIQTYTTATGGLPGATPGPQAESVTLQNLSTTGACSDAYFSNAGAACTIGLAAQIDVGQTQPVPGLSVSAVINGQTTPLCYQTGGTFQGLWATIPLGTQNSGCPNGVGPLTVPAANTTGTSNSWQIDLKVTCKKTTGGCPGNTNTTLPDVQRSYTADSSTSGQIGALDLAQNSVGDANSFEACDAHDSQQCTYSSLTFSMGVEEFANQTIGTGQPIILHLQTGSTASTTGLVECGVPGGNAVRDSIEHGCPGSYVINGDPTDPHGSDPNCTFIDQMPTPPSDCVGSKNGINNGPISQGFAYRICGVGAANPSKCSGATGDTDLNGNPTGSVAYCPNNWTSGTVIPSNDSRLIPMFVTPFASLSSGGPWPIINFAEFYVVDYPKDISTGNNGGCGSDPQLVPDNSTEVAGYFVKFVTVNAGGTGGGLCNQNAFGNCVAILTQ